MIETNIEFTGADSIMIMCDNRNFSVYKEIKSVNIEYCTKHHINFRYYSTYDDNIPPYWWKVFIIRDVMIQYADSIKYVCWMDSDALVFDDDTHFKHFFNSSNTSVYFIGPSDVITAISLLSKFATYLGCNTTFQASVFMLKNNSTTIQMLNDWVASYDSTKWIVVNNKVKYIGTEPFGGTDYEQGNFVVHVIPKYFRHIKLLPFGILNSSTIRPRRGKHWSLHFQINEIYYRYKAVHYK